MSEAETTSKFQEFDLIFGKMRMTNTFHSLLNRVNPPQENLHIHESYVIDIRRYTFFASYNAHSKELVISQTTVAAAKL